MSNYQAQANSISVDCEEFIACFKKTFVTAFHAMTVEVANLANKNFDEDVDSADKRHKSIETDWQVFVSETDLRPHVCNVLKQDFGQNSNLEATQNRLQKTRVDHVQWAGAVLLIDEAASRALLYIVKTKVASSIRKSFSNQPCAFEAIQDLTSHLLEADEELEKSRLSSYRGVAALDSWLIGIGINLARNKCKRKRVISLDDSDDQASGDHQFSPAAPNVDSQAIERTAGDLRRQLIASIAETMEKMTYQERLVFTLVWINGYKPAEVAGYLGVSRPRISQILVSIRTKVARTADETLSQLAQETGCNKEKLADYLSDLLVYVSDSEKGPCRQEMNDVSSKFAEIAEVVAASGQVTNSTVRAF